jgi:4-amino-4-deoxy-L-arabinose transferase-like glycosyltransferase
MLASRRAEPASGVAVAYTTPVDREATGLGFRLLCARNALLVLAAFLNLLWIGWGLPNRGDWAVDSIAPMGPLRYAKMVIAGETWWGKYPAFHYALLSVIYAPYVAFLLATGRLRIEKTEFAVDDAEGSFGVLILIARLVSAAMGVGVTLIAYAVTTRLFGPRAALFAGLIVCSSPLVIYYSHTANVDIPYVFWSGLAIWSFVKLMDSPATRHYIALGLFCGLAIATKDQAYGLFAVLPIALAWARARQGMGLIRATVGGPVLLTGTVAVATYALASNLLFDPAGWLAHFRHMAQHTAPEYRAYERSMPGTFHFAVATLTTLAASLNIPLFALCVVGTGWCLWKREGAALPLLFGLSYFVTVLMLVLYLLPRFVLPLVLLLSPYGGRALAAVWERGRRPGRLLVMGVLLYSLVYGFSLDLEFLHDARYEAERWIAANVPRSAVIGTDGRETYLPRLPASNTTISVELRDRQAWKDGIRPDFLVLSSPRYRRQRWDAPYRQTFEALHDGSLGYRVAATFTSHRFLGPRLIPGLSPDIIVLAR